MREKIITQATELFLTYGFKSVTMDDIAQQLGMSKKTIYQYFKNKTALVEATTLHLFEFISNGIDAICAVEKNPIAEIFEIKRFVMTHLKNEKSSPQYQLQKYYPKIFNALKKNQMHIMNTCVIDNLKRGVDAGLYRDTININFISRLYFGCMQMLKDIDLFPPQQFGMNHIMENYIEYHLRGICTETGLETLKQHLTKYNINEK
ncbi:TetR/AcrR family transcriptional regulator [Flavobacteriaceae bacterium F08102]|nr:TetR/AcrR family transcriptional regulator [Flavobacteriaceae bacterium F08102]